MKNRIILKQLIAGCIIGLLSALAGAYLFIYFFTDFDFIDGINSLKAAEQLGKLITLGAILNIIIFFILLKLEKEIIARGIVLASILLAIITIFV